MPLPAFQVAHDGEVAPRFGRIAELGVRLGQALRHDPARPLETRLEVVLLPLEQNDGVEGVEAEAVRAEAPLVGGEQRGDERAGRVTHQRDASRSRRQSVRCCG